MCVYFTKGLASVMIPGATINVIVRASRSLLLLQKQQQKASTITKWFPTFMGIVSIPVIIHPIDTLVDYALDNTTRLWIPLPKEESSDESF